MSMYKQFLINEMYELSQDEKVRFIGYNTRYGHRMYGTLNKVPKKQCIEMPLCESLMVGMAEGMSLEGFKPIVCFERQDFMLIASDQIINHLALMPKLSGDQFHFPVVIRAIVGSRNPKFDLGLQHTKDLTYIFKPYINIISFTKKEYTNYEWNEPIIITEQKELYEKIL